MEVHFEKEKNNLDENSTIQLSIKSNFKTYKLIDPNKQFTVMSYNILANKFTKEKYFPYCPPEYLNINYRLKVILDEIEYINSDIICLQECDYDLSSNSFIETIHSLGYHAAYKHTNIQRNVTLMICFKKELFEEIQFTFVNMDNFFIDLNDKEFNRNGEAIILKLKHINLNKSFFICNTHLYWDPKLEYVKYGQISNLIKHSESLIKDDSLPFIMCGDMNSLPSSNVLRYIYDLPPIIDLSLGDKVNNKKYLDKFYNDNRHSLKIRSAYDVYKIENDIENNYLDKDFYTKTHPDFTNITHEFSGNIDYIFYTSEKLQIANLIHVPNDDYIKKNKAPSYHYPSDHLKIAASFYFK